MERVAENFRSRDYWIVENTLYTEPSFRLRKCASVVNRLAGERECSLLDVGCGPGALRKVLRGNVDYRGIDIAIHHPDPCFRESDIAREPIRFGNMRFDFVVAMGFFEYMGGRQREKFAEIRDILTDGGTFILSYINFGHFRRRVWPNYNNVQSIAEMARGLSELFVVQKCFPASHHWRQKQPGERSLQNLQMQINFSIPLISSMLAVEYFFVCSVR